MVLEHNGGNQTKTAKSLGISRTTLWRMLCQPLANGFASFCSEATRQ
ncbi:MAG: helix-turn-helix domain-containing protein [Oscillospiraceae bacterium]|nr:helix-turn-helix domain-containing protein [Oscillospiraceae bacterium]